MDRSRTERTRPRLATWSESEAACLDMLIRLLFVGVFCVPEWLVPSIDWLVLFLVRLSNLCMSEAGTSFVS